MTVAVNFPLHAAASLRVKAIEALGRLHAVRRISAETDCGIARGLGWQHPQELRITALQVLEKLGAGMGARIHARKRH